MGDAAKTRVRLEELRAVGDRLMLGDPDARKVRGLVCDLIDVLLGRVANHDDVNVSGARAPALAPELIRQVIPGQHGGPPSSRPQLALAAPHDAASDADTIAEIERMAAGAGASTTAAAPTGEPPPAISLEEALAMSRARKEAAAAAASKTPPNGGQ